MTIKKSLIFITYDSVYSNYLKSYFKNLLTGVEKEGIDISVIQLLMAGNNRQYSIGENISVHTFGFKNKIERLLKSILITWQIFRTEEATEKIYLARSILPAAILILSLKIKNCYIIYDADGFAWREYAERTEKNGINVELYKAFAKLIERIIISRSSLVLTRTTIAQRYYSIHYARSNSQGKKVPVKLLKNGCKLDEQRLETFQSIPKRQKLKFVILGSLGDQYCIHNCLQIMCELKNRFNSLSIKVVTHDRLNLPKVQALISLYGLHSEIISCAHEDLPEMLSDCHAGFVFRRESAAMKGVYPLKVSELICCGVAVISYRYQKLDLPSFLNFEVEPNKLQIDELANFILGLEGMRNEIRQYGLRHLGIETDIMTICKGLEEF